MAVKKAKASPAGAKAEVAQLEAKSDLKGGNEAPVKINLYDGGALKGALDDYAKEVGRISATMKRCPMQNTLLDKERL